MNYVKVIGIVLAVLVMAAMVSAIEQPACYKNVKPWGWGPMPEKSNQSSVQVSDGHVLTGNVLIMPDIAGLKELQAKFG